MAGRAFRNPRFQLAVVPMTYDNRGNTHPTASSDPLKELLRCFKLPDAVMSWYQADRDQFMVVPGPLSIIHLLSFRSWMVAWHPDTISDTVRTVLLCSSQPEMKEEVVDKVQKFLEDLAPTVSNHELAGLLAVSLRLAASVSHMNTLEQLGRHTESNIDAIMTNNKLEEAENLSSLTTIQRDNVIYSIWQRSSVHVAISYIDYLLDTQHKSVFPLRSSNGIYIVQLESLKRLGDSIAAQITRTIDEGNLSLSTLNNMISQRDQAISLAIAKTSREIALQSRIDQENSLAIANASKSIAEESRRDSRAMKMIAIVTMIYLPGTFVATAFSMGIFEWSAVASVDVVNPRIWLYFLFTGVLTIVTIGSFLAWTWWQERQLPILQDAKQETGVPSPLNKVEVQ